MKKNILIADDHYVVRTGTGLLLEAKLKYPCTADFAESYTDAKDKISKKQYDLVILDIDMPDSIFKAMIKELRDIQNDLKILIFSAYDEKITLQYIDDGAAGYINKNSNEHEILDAVSSILEKGYYYSQQIMNEILNRTKNINPIDKLSQRELEVFKLLVEGNGNVEISSILGIRMTTISTYKKKIFEKLKAKTIVDLIRINNDLH